MVFTDLQYFDAFYGGMCVTWRNIAQKRNPAQVEGDKAKGFIT
jgi:hypothetical protein